MGLTDDTSLETQGMVAVPGHQDQHLFICLPRQPLASKLALSSLDDHTESRESEVCTCVA